MSATLGLLLGFGAALPASGTGQEPEPVVHAVLFYSPTCPHCHALINNHLIPLQEQYGSKLVLLALDVTQSWASEIYWAALRQYNVPEEDWVVPIMLLKDEILIGGDEIPTRLVQVLQEDLAADGADLPDLPALLDLLEEQGLLDHRFPGRRIVLQAAPEEAPPEETPVPKPENPRQEALPAVDSLRPEIPDTTASDTLAPQHPLPVPDTPPARRGASPDSATPATAPSEDSARAPAPSGDSALAPDPAEGPVDVPGGPTGAEAEGPARQAAPDSLAQGAEVQGGTGEGEARRTRPMDLAEAVQEMESMTMMDRFHQDRAGNSLSVVVLLGMLLSVILRGYPPRIRARPWPTWSVPLLVVVGMSVAAYLSFIEVTHAEAVCGPVGDCNTVNQSEYARLFGVLPVGVLGLLGYLLILALWALGRRGPADLRDRADLSVWGVALAGTLFSIYLTFLEPFVIGATCAWCLSSALVMTLILWAAAPSAARAWSGAPVAGG